MTEGAKDWDERQRRFKEFDKGVFSIMKLALAGDLTPTDLARVKRDVLLTMSSEVRAEMLLYTNDIEISVSGHQYRCGWWWDRKTHKYINVELTFDPYGSSLSAWTDPAAPDGVVLFQ